jgi:hypothetical protein
MWLSLFLVEYSNNIDGTKPSGLLIYSISPADEQNMRCNGGIELDVFLGKEKCKTMK